MKGNQLAYHAYLLRLWRERADDPWRILLEKAATGERHGFGSLESLFSYLDHLAYSGKEIETMSEHPNAALIKKGIDAFNQGNPDLLLGLIADDAIFNVPGNSPIAGQYRGKEAIGRFFRHMSQLSGGSQQIELWALLTSGDDYVVAIWKAYGRRQDITYEGLAGWIFRICNGQIVEGRNLQEDQDEIDAFWST